MRSDRDEWQRMRAALWPYTREDHAEEIDGYLRGPQERAAAEAWAVGLGLSEMASDSELHNAKPFGGHAGGGSL